jgi:hypothetical protein
MRGDGVWDKDGPAFDVWHIDWLFAPASAED